MKFEDFCVFVICLFIGEEYFVSLCDDCEIYIYGDCVKDVISYFVFCNVVVFMVWFYDVLYDLQSKEKFCWEIDIGNGGYIYKFFCYVCSVDELCQQCDVIVEWLWLIYGWMGCILDYKVVFGSVFGVNLGFYGCFEDNVKIWYKCIQEVCLYFNYVIVNLLIDCDKLVDQVKDVFILVDEEVDGGIVVSGVKVVVMNFVLIYYNFVGQGLV